MRIIVLILVMSLLRGVLPAQQTYFSNNYQDSNCPNYIGTVVQNPDTGYFIVSNNLTANFNGFSIIRTNPSGDTLFSKNYPSALESFSLGATHGLIQTWDENYLVCGSVVDTANNRDGYLMKFDSAGDTLWTKKYGGSDYDVLFSIYEASDSSFWICGTTWSQGNGQGDIWILHLDEQCNYLWDSAYGTSQNESGVCGEVCSDGSFVASGLSYNVPFVVKIDPQGAEQWSYVYSNFNGYGFISQLSDSSFILATNKILSSTEDQGAVLHLNSDGSEDWFSYVGFINNDEVLFAKPIVTLDGIVISGTSTPQAGNAGAFLAKTDLSGNLVWQRRYTFNTNLPQETYDVKHTNDNGFIMAGYCIQNNQDAWLVKVDSMGCEVAGCDGVGMMELENESRLSVYPNPASNDATVRLASIGGKETYIEVSNSLGQVVDNISLNGLTTAQLITESYPAGLFHLRLLENGECLASEKLLIIK